MSTPDADLTLLLSKALSFAIIAGSVIMQAPQIYKIVKARSAAGLTPLGWMSSVVAMTLTVSYNYRKGYPFSTYGELIFIMVQLDILILLVVHFNDGGVAWKGPLGVAAHAALLAACLSGVVPDQALVTMPMGLSCLSGTPQLGTNFRSGNTGQLATLPGFPVWEREAFDSFHTHFSKVTNQCSSESGWSVVRWSIPTSLAWAPSLCFPTDCLLRT